MIGKENPVPNPREKGETTKSNRLKLLDNQKESVSGLILSLQNGHGFVLEDHFAVLVDRYNEEMVQIRHAKISGLDYSTLKEPQRSTIVYGRKYFFEGTEIKFRALNDEYMYSRVKFVICAPQDVNIFRDKVIDRGVTKDFHRDVYSKLEFK